MCFRELINKLLVALLATAWKEATSRCFLVKGEGNLEDSLYHAKDDLYLFDRLRKKGRAVPNHHPLAGKQSTFLPRQPAVKNVIWVRKLNLPVTKMRTFEYHFLLPVKENIKRPPSPMK